MISSRGVSIIHVFIFSPDREDLKKILPVGKD